MDRKVNLAGRLVGQGEPPFIVADIGANHNGDMDLCKHLVDAAFECKVDAAKFQSWTEATLFSRVMYDQNPELHKQVKRYQLTPEQHLEIQKYCMSKDIAFFSTPFSIEEADMLEGMDVPYFKIASMHVTCLSFLRHIARKKRPMIVSTGMATLGEIEQAVNAIRGEENEQIVLLHCVALYPPGFDAVNLRNIQTLSDMFDVPVGFSDHTIGFGCSLAAIALGACVIERHFTLDKSMEGWDHAISSDPADMAMIVQEGRNIWRSLGSYRRIVAEAEIEKARVFRPSLVTQNTMEAGDVITEKDLDFKRPGIGIRPDEMTYVLNRRLAKNIEEDEVLTWDHLE